MAKTASIGIRVEPTFKEKLDKAAREENRSVPNLIETVIQEWFDERQQKRSVSSGTKTKK